MRTSVGDWGGAGKVDGISQSEVETAGGVDVMATAAGWKRWPRVLWRSRGPRLSGSAGVEVAAAWRSRRRRRTGGRGDGGGQEVAAAWR